MERPNFFDYSDDDTMCEISRLVRCNEKTKLRKILIKRKMKKNARAHQPLAADNRGWTAVHVAASRKECDECLKLMLRYGEYVALDVNARSFEGKTALFIACERGCDENVLSLLQKGGDANAKTPDGTSPLHVASTKGHDAIVGHLLRYGAAIDVQDWQGFTPLHLAALYDRYDVCEMLLENKANTCTSDSDGNLALHLACQSASWRTIRPLLDKCDDADVDRQNDDGITPLMLAARSGQNEECVERLLQRGASAKATSKDGLVALQFAAVGGNADVLRTLLGQTEYVDVDEKCFRRARDVVSNDDGQGERIFYSVVCCALASASVACLSVLLQSSLEKKILEAPYVERSANDRNIDLYSPLAYLFSVRSDRVESVDETLDQLVRLLLRHGIVYANTFVHQLKQTLNVEWTSILHSGRVNLVNPYDIIFNSRWPESKKLAYSALLDEFDVTVDYCLQCYGNYDNHNQTRWRDFDVRGGYDVYYRPVLEAVDAGQVHLLGLYLSHSCILEPDRLCRYLVIAKSSESRAAISTEARSVYDYLVALQPSYYRNDNYARKMRAFNSISTAEEFSRSNLQQLCRTIIRHQLRAVTLIDNLRTFRRKILHLPLPSYLKDYLLFRN